MNPPPPVTSSCTEAHSFRLERPRHDSHRERRNAAGEHRLIRRERPTSYHQRALRNERTTILAVVGTRPNFMKTAPVLARLGERQDRFDPVLVHTGQHYDDEMSRIFVEELGIGEPDHFLGVGSGTHAVQAARILERLEAVLDRTRPDLVLVPGDVNSTLAAALAAAQRQIPVGHIEAGLRSFDRTMPEELNRVLTDMMADHLFIHSPEARDNLVAEGRPDAAIHYVGNTMIDTLVTMREHFEALDAPARHGVRPGDYVVVTLHRPALVDGPLLAEAIAALNAIADEIPVILPAHPRTRAALEAGGIAASSSGLRIVSPLGYLEFMGLTAGAAAVVTDSGGIQEETTYLGIPCFTLRDNTERPVTVELGTNTLLGLRPERIRDVPGLLRRPAKGAPQVPPLWDGHAAERLVAVLARDAALASSAA
jgi:UDP-N-acetylglucosamine 2-epimerase (non-hydrolysing)